MINKIILILLAICTVSCSQINKKLGLADDNAAEEIFEQVIKQKTGLDLDLTPQSEELPVG